MLIEAVIDSIRVTLATESRLVLLKERHGDRHLAIWIGDFEAQAISMGLENQTSPRPLPYDLFKSLLMELEAEVEQVLVTELSNDVFFARIVVRTKQKTLEIDARPSDAIAIAVRTGAPIFVDESVLDKAGVSLSATESSDASDLLDPIVRPDRAKTQETEDTLSLFRDFINQIERTEDEPESPAREE